MVVDPVEGGVFRDVEFVDRGKLDVAVFGHFDVIFQEKTADIDEFDLVDKFVFESIIEGHPFVVKKVTVRIEHVAGVLGGKIAVEISEGIFDPLMFVGKGVALDKDIAWTQFDVFTSVPITIGRIAHTQFGVDLFP